MTEDRRKNDKIFIEVLDEKLSLIKEANDKAHEEIKEKIDCIHNVQREMSEIRESVGWLKKGFWIVATAIIGVIVKLFNIRGG